MNDLPRRFRSAPFGTVYLVDPSIDRATRERDINSISSLGFNTVVIWPPVSRWTAAEIGGLSFTEIDHALDTCHRYHLDVILELQGQSLAFQESPEALRSGRRRPGILDPERRASILSYIRAIASHFKGHPALVAYDVYNEVEFDFDTDFSIEDFRSFLREQYGDEVSALNDAWRTFYRSFSDIELTDLEYGERSWLSVIPMRDLRRFAPWAFSRELGQWIAAIRKIDDKTMIVSDSLGVDTIPKPERYQMNDWQIASHADVFGLSCYANMFNPEWWNRDCYMWPQYWRTAKSASRGKDAIISEMMTPNRTLFPAEGSSMSDQILLWSLQAICHGMNGLIYWKYRPFRWGRQVAGRGLCDARGGITRIGQMAASAAAYFKRWQPEIRDLLPYDNGCAILFDHNTEDLVQTLHASDNDLYAASVSGVFRGFWNSGICPSYLTASDIETGVPNTISVLALPLPVALSETVARALREFVERGGALLTESRFALIDNEGRLNDTCPGFGLNELSGYREIEIDSRFSGTAEIDGTELFFDNEYLQHLEVTEQTSVIARTVDGKPLAVRTCRKGIVVHCACNLGDIIYRSVRGAEALFSLLLNATIAWTNQQVRVVTKPPKADVSLLADRNGRVVFAGITNFEETDARVVLEGFFPGSVDATSSCLVEQDGRNIVSRLLKNVPG